MKGIILAGGAGTRLYPLTVATSKQLLPVYDKPMIYYPLSTLMLAGIRDILVVSTPEDLPRFERLLGDGQPFGVRLQYVAQPSPDGPAQALALGEAFLGNEACATVLGDNIFHGDGFVSILREARENAERRGRATAFGHYVSDPERFGVAVFDGDGRAVRLEEKPQSPGSHCAVTGLYFYPAGVCARARRVRPGPRGEFEITALNNLYLSEGLLDVRLLDRDFFWLDAGTADSLLEAADFVRGIQQRQGVRIGAPEAIAYAQGWITREALMRSAERCDGSPYGRHLKALAEGKALH